MPEPSPDAALFAALVAARPAPPPEPLDGMAEMALRLAESVRHLSALLYEASAGLAEGKTARLPELLARAEVASLEQAACARGLLEALGRTETHRAAA